MPAQIGSISSGTLRTEDLLSAFAWELEHLAKEFPGNDEHLKLVAEAETVKPDSDEASYVLEDLIDALGEYAPPYCYFGVNEGDGADFGFWPSMDAVDELPRVNDSDEAKALGADCVFVNDHGNITVYGGDGSVIWDCV